MSMIQSMLALPTFECDHVTTESSFVKLQNRQELTLYVGPYLPLAVAQHSFSTLDKLCGSFLSASQTTAC